MNQLVENKKKWELLYDRIKTMEYGDIISHDDISSVIGESYDSKNYHSIINRARKELLKASKAIESVRGQGYRVLMPSDYAFESVKTFKQGFNKFQKAKTTLDCTPIKELSVEDLKVHRNVCDRVSVLHAHLSGAKTELNLLAKKSSAYLPENVGRN